MRLCAVISIVILSAVGCSSEEFDHTIPKESCMQFGAFGILSDFGVAEVPIPDGSTDGVLVDRDAFFSNSAVSIVELDVHIDHARVSDVSLTLVSPNGTTALLMDKVDKVGENLGPKDVGTRFSDCATLDIAEGIPPFVGSYRPVEPLSIFNGEIGQGNWRLKIVDSVAGESGKLTDWNPILN